jgi:hypothetical protein
MPVVESRCVVPVDVETAFAVSQTTGQIRKRWDPFIRTQYFLGGATAPAKGVHTYTVQRFGFRMESEYVSFKPPSNVGMKMTKGSWFFERLGGDGGSASPRVIPAARLPCGATTSRASRSGSLRLQNASARSSSNAISTGASVVLRGAAKTP